MTSEQIIGPLLMEIDVPNPSQRLLVEQALSTKQLTCFLARTDEARDKLNRMVGGQPINTYRYKGQYQPRQRPSSKELARFGVTGWLDEALVTKPEHRNDVLGILKDNTQADLMLLGTQETSNEIEELSKYLKSKGMTNVQVITPDVRRTVASNQRRQISAYSAPHAPGRSTGGQTTTTSSRRRPRSRSAARAFPRARCATRATRAATWCGAARAAGRRRASVILSVYCSSRRRRFATRTMTRRWVNAGSASSFMEALFDLRWRELGGFISWIARRRRLIHGGFTRGWNCLRPFT